MSKKGCVTQALMVSHCCVMKLQNNVQTHEENALRTQGGGNANLLKSGALFVLLLIRKRLICPLAHLECSALYDSLFSNYVYEKCFK